jgi:hypothetical protein
MDIKKNPTTGSKCEVEHGSEKTGFNAEYRRVGAESR